MTNSYWSLSEKSKALGIYSFKIIVHNLLISEIEVCYYVPINPVKSPFCKIQRIFFLSFLYLKSNDP